MATPMPSGEKRYADRKRVVVFVSLETGYLLDLLSRYQCVTKKSLHDEIWRAGLEAHLGLTAEEIEEAQASPLPRGTAAPGDLKKLAQALVADR